MALSVNATFCQTGQQTSPPYTTPASASMNNTAGTIAANANRVLIGWCLYRNTGTPTTRTLTWSGQSMTQIGSLISTTGGPMHIQLFGLINPNSGSATMQANWNTTQLFAVGGICFDGADQSTGWTNAGSNTGGTSPATSSFTLSGNAAVVAHVNDNGASPAFTAGTQIFIETVLDGNYGAAYRVTTGDVTWTFTGTHDWANAYVEVLPAGGGNTAISASAGSISLDNVAATTQIYQVAVTVQDITDGTWLPSAGADLYATLDDDSDADYDYTAGNSTMEVKFGSLSDPTTSSGHTLSYRIKGNGSATITVYLIQGPAEGTVIATYAHANAAAVLTSYEQLLSEAEANSITDYTDLRLRVTTS